MKLSEYVNKPKKISTKSSTQFVLNNSTVENSLKDEINTLQSELSRLKSVQQERDDATSKLTHEKIKHKESSIIYNKTKDENLLLHKNIEFLNKKVAQLTKIETNHKELSSKHGELNNKFMLLQEQMSKKINDYNTIKKQTDGLKSENKQLTAETHQANENKFSAEEERKQVLESNEYLKSYSDKTSKINIGLREDNKTLRDEVNLHRKEAQERGVALNESKTLENKLRGWVTSLETTQSNTSSKNVGLNKKIKVLQETTQDMANTIEQMLNENTYLREINKKYRFELSKPRYISMATISKRENLNMPTETVYRRSVGNSPQPLIKFKQENKDDN